MNCLNSHHFPVSCKSNIEPSILERAIVAFSKVLFCLYIKQQNGDYQTKFILKIALTLVYCYWFYIVCYTKAYYCCGVVWINPTPFKFQSEQLWLVVHIYIFITDHKTFAQYDIQNWWCHSTLNNLLHMQVCNIKIMHTFYVIF